MSENVMELINAIQSGKSLEIESSFNKVMADKLHFAIDSRREDISRNLLGAREEAVEPTEVASEQEPNEV